MAATPTDGANALDTDAFDSAPDSELPSSTSSGIPQDTDLASAPGSTKTPEPESVTEVPVVSQIVASAPQRTLDEEADFPEFEDFFRNGDDGLYAGGPGDSIAPVTTPDPFADEADADPWTSPSDALLARRDRFKRYVTTLIGSLAAGSLLLFGVHGLSAPRVDAPVRVAQAAAPAAAPRAETPEAAQPLAPAAEPIVDAVPELTVSAAADEQETASARHATPASAATTLPAPKAVPTRRLVAAAPALRANRPRTPHVDTRPPAVVAPPVVRSNTPPSAAFPD